MTREQEAERRRLHADLERMQQLEEAHLEEELRGQEEADAGEDSDDLSGDEGHVPGATPFFSVPVPGSNGNLVCRAQNDLVPSCVSACTSDAECGNSADTSGPYGPDNYACDDGGCRFAGCNDDAECQTLGNYVCDTFGAIAYCVRGCVTVDDCVTVDAAAPYDSNNYACERGRCAYTGCVSDRECSDLGDYTCH